MDCLFTDKEAKEMLIYMREMQNQNIQMQIFVAPDWDLAHSSWTTKYTHPPAVWATEGFIGTYYGAPVYVFSGMDSHTCCVMPIYK